MTKQIVTAIILVACALKLNAQGYEVKQDMGENGQHRVTLTLNEWCVSPVTIGRTQYERIDFESTMCDSPKGWAAIPFVSTNVQIADKKVVISKVIENTGFSMSLKYPLVPSRGTIYRNQNPDSVAYQIDPKSMLEKQYPSNIYEIGEPYWIKDSKWIQIKLFPFVYNAVEQKLQIITDITLEIIEVDEDSRSTGNSESTRRRTR